MTDITLTQNAVAHFQKALMDKPEVVGIRLGVKNSGCSGLSYILDYAKEIKEEDKVYKTADVAVVVDLKSLPFLMGTEIDCVHSGLNETHIKFNNPNVKSECGCGESFNTQK